MDNITHTLFGLTLAKAGLERATPLATATLLVSSNLPDIDNLMWVRGPAAALEHHRGLTHSFAGLAALALGLTLVLIFLDHAFRLRRDPFLRPIRPVRTFGVAYVGGLGHMLMDLTNTYGVRLLMPFSDRWFYGDLAFIVDPWIWLILGSVAWLTANSPSRVLLWSAIGLGAAFLVGLFGRHPAQAQMVLPLPPIPVAARAIWFGGLAIVIVGAVLSRGRAGPRIARYALVVLTLYYGVTWMLHSSALEQATARLPADGVKSAAVWPTPANPLRWQAIAATEESVFAGYVFLGSPAVEWRELPLLDGELSKALSASTEARTFLEFSRYATATVQEGDGGYQIMLRDLRFPLQMTAALDRDSAVKAAEVGWY
jgi:inner membrane protein